MFSTVSATPVPETMGEKEMPSVDPYVCPTHGQSKTPRLDAHLQEPNTQALIHAFGTTWSDKDQCTQCAVDSISAALTTYLKSMQEAKKSGKLSKAEKKELKKEMKMLYNGLKGDMRKAMRS